jgi:hypothetical protein
LEGFWNRLKEEEITMKAKIFVWGRNAALIIILLVISFYAAQAFANPTTSVMAQDNIQASEPNIPNEPNASFHCPVVTGIATFTNRIHLRCNIPNGSIIYYAYPNDQAHSAVAGQLLAVINTASALGKGIDVYYNDDPSLNPPGCGTGDCRGLVGVESR